MSNFTVTDVADKSFDYVIAGGGTAGLTLAARLSEDPSVTVLVLEAGPPNLDDPNIFLINRFGKTFTNPKYDWAFSTVKQPYSNDRQILWSRGKNLGGSSAMNLCAWVKPPAADINAIERLGNPGWGWESFVKYSMKNETFTAPAASLPIAFNSKNRGTTGPIHAAFPPMVNTTEEIFQRSMTNLGVNPNENPYDGDNTGSWVDNLTFDPKTLLRSYAVTGYYLPNKDRPNLTVVTDATVAKVLFADRQADADDNLTATGVEFRLASNASHAHVVHARKEVILAAGAIQSPQLLELSGIGRKDVLDRLGIDVKIDLPGVGENVQEHSMITVGFLLEQDFSPQANGTLPEEAAQSPHAAEMERMLVLAQSYIPLSVANPKEFSALVAKAEKTVEEQKASGKLPPGLAEQYDLRLETLKDHSIPDIQVIGISARPDPTVTRPRKQRFNMILNHPLSRGTIHAISLDPFQPPEIDPHYFENDFDLELLVQHFKFMKALSQVEPMNSIIAHEEDPKMNCTTDEEIREYIKNTSGTSWHTLGSCSMLPREKQGVVDPELKVYGTDNLRVVDLSIIPIQIAAHTQATVYVIAEKAADIIRGIH